MRRRHSDEAIRGQRSTGGTPRSPAYGAWSNVPPRNDRDGVSAATEGGSTQGGHVLEEVTRRARAFRLAAEQLRMEASAAVEGLTAVEGMAAGVRHVDHGKHTYLRKTSSREARRRPPMSDNAGAAWVAAVSRRRPYGYMEGTAARDGLRYNVRVPTVVVRAGCRSS